MLLLLYVAIFLSGISLSEFEKHEHPQQYSVTLCSHGCNGRGYCSRNMNGTFVCKCYGKYFGLGCEHPQMPVHLAQLYSRKNHSITINSSGYYGLSSLWLVILSIT